MRHQLRRYTLALSFVLAVTTRALAQGPAFTTFDVPGATDITAYDINPAGEIVGRAITADGVNHGYLRSPQGGFTTIDYPGSDFSVAAGINPRGDIVGFYRLAGEPQNVRHAFLRSKDGNFTSFDFPGAFFTQAKGINPRGDIAGTYCIVAPCAPGGGNAHGYLLAGGQFTSIDFPGAIQNDAEKIGPAGQIVGSYQSTDGKFHDYLFSTGAFTTIDFPGAIRTGGDFGNAGINSRGDIVGTYCNVVPCNFDIRGGYHGFLRSQRGEYTAIDFPAAISAGAFGINSGGDIAGEYTDTSGKNHGFLLQPGLIYTKRSAPQIVMTPGGPAVTHSSDFSLVSASRPAAPGEILSAFVTGLGPTRPGVDPGKPFPTSPLAVVNSPVNVTVNGKSAEVTAAVGLPGAVDGYQVNFRVPPDTAKGVAAVQISAAWIAGSEVRIPVQQ